MKITTSNGLQLRVQGPWAALVRVAAVAANTLREAGRAKLFYGVLGAAVLLLAFSLVLSDLALVDQKARLVQSFGMVVIPLVCLVTATLLGVELLHKEIDKKTLYAILPKPVRRSEFLIGKYLGLLTLLTGQLAVLVVCWWSVLVLRGGQLTGPLVRTFALALVELVVVTAVAMFFSALTRPVLSGVFTLGMVLVGRSNYVIADLLGANKGVFAEVPAMRTLGKLLVAAVPDLSTFAVADPVLHGWVVPWHYLLTACLYGGSWACVFLVGAVILFERRDFT
ncbi:MAG: ABC transporter permease [Myxococcales bacterium]|nr:ABC transporter permease [Myxococcales bacterium]